MSERAWAVISNGRILVYSISLFEGVAEDTAKAVNGRVVPVLITEVKEE